MTTAINVFLRQSLRTGGFPFPVCLEQPNKTTIAALQEAKQIVNDPNYKYYTDVESALRDLKALKCPLYSVVKRAHTNFSVSMN